MKSTPTLIAALTISAAFCGDVRATAPMNACNAAGECRARLVTVYTYGNTAYAVLEGHLIPSVCTSAAWGYYWTLNLTAEGDKARYGMLLAAYMGDKTVELRASDASCVIIASALGE